jgi:hypothetical protein
MGMVAQGLVQDVARKSQQVLQFDIAAALHQILTQVRVIE